MGSVTDHLDRIRLEREREEAEKALRHAGGNVNKQKNPSGHGKGKWHSKKSLAAYRKKRDAKRRG